ncbi:MAG: hypothetical protein RMY34_20540 [Aulosira sp. DedQUE10]|nr:hypothetical protein [Aulosira sp. DedQUE10]
MPSIKISELRPIGSELFQDSESYLNELNVQDMEIIGGGKFVITSVINTSVISQASASQGISVNTFSQVSKL